MSIRNAKTRLVATPLNSSGCVAGSKACGCTPPSLRQAPPVSPEPLYVMVSPPDRAFATGHGNHVPGCKCHGHINWRKYSGITEARRLPPLVSRSHPGEHLAASPDREGTYGEGRGGTLPLRGGSGPRYQCLAAEGQSRGLLLRRLPGLCA